MEFFYNLPIIKDLDLEAFGIRMNEMDFEGQNLSETVYKYVIGFSLAVAICISFYTKCMSNGVYIIILGTILATIATVPSWPCYNKNPLKWLPYVKPKPTEVSDEKNEKEKQK